MQPAKLLAAVNGPATKLFAVMNDPAANLNCFLNLLLDIPVLRPAARTSTRCRLRGRAALVRVSRLHGINQAGRRLISSCRRMCSLRRWPHARVRGHHVADRPARRRHSYMNFRAVADKDGIRIK
jgi:hypothetical protein